MKQGGKKREPGVLRDGRVQRDGQREKAEGEGIHREVGGGLEKRVALSWQRLLEEIRPQARCDLLRVQTNAGGGIRRKRAAGRDWGLLARRPGNVRCGVTRARGPRRGRGSPKFAVEPPTQSPRLGEDLCKRVGLGTPRARIPSHPLHPLAGGGCWPRSPWRSQMSTLEGARGSLSRARSGRSGPGDEDREGACWVRGARRRWGA